MKLACHLAVLCFVAPRVLGVAGESTAKMELDSLSSTKPEAIFDALIAAGRNFQTLTWSDMTYLLECATDSDSTIESLRQSIGTMVDKLLKKAESDKGRVVEYTPLQNVNLGDNYEARVKGGTLVCFTHFAQPSVAGIDEEVYIGPGSYAAQIIASTEGDITPKELDDPKRYSLSMLVEANVVELGGAGLLYVPKKYCLELGDVHDEGISGGGRNSIAKTGKNGMVRPVALGLKFEPLTSFKNRVSWVLKNDTQESIDILKNAYTNPKVELLAQVLPTGLENNKCSSSNIYPCLERIVEEAFGLRYDPVGGQVALRQHLWMASQLKAWRKAVEAVLGDNGTFHFPAPLVFDEGIATTRKNGFVAAVQANPYFTREELFGKIGVGYPIGADDVATCARKANATSIGQGAADSWHSALKRRLFEYEGVPKGQLKQWALHDNGWLEKGGNLDAFLGEFFDNFTTFSDPRYFSQKVSWNSLDELETGNLTTKVMGKTADWFMVTNFSDSSVLHEMFEWHDAASDEAYATAASAAARADNPCGSAATNSDIYLLTIGVALAVFGGVYGVAGSLHDLLHWAWTFGSFETQTLFTGRFWPTYELWMAIFGIAAFLTLYAPLVYAYVVEKDISEYHTSAENVVVRYGGNPMGDPESIGGVPTLVTLVYVETGCEEARPEALAILLGVSLFLGIVLNLPFFCGACRAFARYWKRVKDPDYEDRPNYQCTLQDSGLALLSPGEYEHPEIGTATETDDEDDDVEEGTEDASAHDSPQDTEKHGNVGKHRKEEVGGDTTRHAESGIDDGILVYT